MLENFISDVYYWCHWGVSCFWKPQTLGDWTRSYHLPTNFPASVKWINRFSHELFIGWILFGFQPMKTSFTVSAVSVCLLHAIDSSCHFYYIFLCITKVTCFLWSMEKFRLAFGLAYFEKSMLSLTHFSYCTLFPSISIANIAQLNESQSLSLSKPCPFVCHKEKMTGWN